jgi:hypothetical protein
MVQQLVDRLRREPSRLFLVDGVGAAVSALFLGVVMTALEEYVGMPRSVLVLLALVALALSVYSIRCSYRLPVEWRRCLRIISTANLAYSGVTAGLVVAFWARLTALGVTYFVLEILVITALVVVERRVLAAPDPPMGS